MRRLLLFLALLASCTWARQFEMAKNYNKEDPPPFTKGMNKTFIQATFNLRNILEMSESLQRISLEVRFPIPNYFPTKTSSLKVSLTLFWYDTRLTVNKTLLHGEDERGKYGFRVRMSPLEIGTHHQVPHSDHDGRQQTVDPRPLR